MRLNRLDLARFGHFTDVSLDFGDAPPASATDHCDLHLVYGPNEAGKSTTLAAIVDLLFGMPRQSRFRFLHAYDTLEVAASLQQSNTTLQVHRYKKKLTDAGQQEIPQTTLDTQGLTREQFLQRFSFDDEALQQGGEQILESQGDLGEALFSATSGLSGLHEKLQTILQPARQFYEPGKRVGLALTELNERLRDIDRQLRDNDLNASAWKKQQQAAEDARQLHDTSTEQHQTLEQECERLTRLRNGHILQGRIVRLRTERTPLVEQPELPDTWLAELRQLGPENTRLSTQIDSESHRLHTLQAQRAALVADDCLLARAAAIDRLYADRVRQQSLQAEVNESRITRADIQATIQSHRLKLGINTGPEPLAEELPAGLLDAVDAALKEGAQHQAAALRAAQELETVSQQLMTLSGSEAPPPSPLLLENLNRIIADTAINERLQDALTRERARTAELTSTWQTLQPFTSDAETLQSLTPPDKAQLESLAQQQQDCQHQRHTLEATRSGLLDDIARRERALSQSDVAGVEDAEVLHTRERRDGAWRNHVEQLHDPAAAQLSAHAFAQALAADDALTIERLTRSTEHSAHRHQQAELAGQRQALANTDAELQQQQTRRQQLHTELAACAGQCLLPDTTTVDTLQRWLERREQALEMLQRHRREEAELDALRVQCLSYQQRISTVLADWLDATQAQKLTGAGLDELLPLAQQAYTQLVTQRQHSKQLEQKQRDLKQQQTHRQAAVTEQENTLQRWQQALDALCAGTWLQGRTTERLSEDLPAARTLFTQQATARELSERLAARQQAIDQFLDDVRAIAQADADTLVTVDQACAWLDADYARLSSARQLIKEQQRLDDDIRLTSDSLDRWQSEHAPIKARLTHMLDTSGAESPTQLDRQLEQLQARRALDSQIKTAEAELIEALAVDSLAAAESQLATSERLSLDASLLQLSEQRDAARARLSEHYHQWRALADPLDSMDGEATSARLTEQRATVLLELETGVRQTLRLRAGHAVVLEGLRRFRQTHRSTMMLQARNAFVTLTAGHFSDLRSQPADRTGGADQLVGIREGGGALLAADMSKGTRMQLYLALRVAAYHEYCETRVPMPFIADDIMESFDDQRAAAAFGLLADMARRGQVLYMTHHQHLLDIAREVVGTGLSTHELPGRG